MQFDEMGKTDGKVLFLLPGTACDYQTNFAAVLDALAGRYHLVCVNYDGFDGSGMIFPDMITVTEKIERYIWQNYGGRIDSGRMYIWITAFLAVRIWIKAAGSAHGCSRNWLCRSLQVLRRVIRKRLKPGKSSNSSLR